MGKNEYAKGCGTWWRRHLLCFALWVALFGSPVLWFYLQKITRKAVLLELCPLLPVFPFPCYSFPASLVPTLPLALPPRSRHILTSSRRGRGQGSSTSFSEETEMKNQVALLSLSYFPSSTASFSLFSYFVSYSPCTEGATQLYTSVKIVCGSVWGSNNEHLQPKTKNTKNELVLGAVYTSCSRNRIQ